MTASFRLVGPALIFLALLVGTALAADLTVAAGDLARRLSADLAARSIRRVLVADFTSTSGVETAFGRVVAEELTAGFLKAKGPAVTDRLALDRALKSTGVDASRLSRDEAAVRAVGQSVGVDAIVLGTYLESGKLVRITARAVDVRSSQVLAVASTTADLDAFGSALLTPATPANAASAGATNASGQPAPTRTPAGVTFDPNERLYSVLLSCKKVSFDLPPNGAPFSRVEFSVRPNQLSDGIVNVYVDGGLRYTQRYTTSSEFRVAGLVGPATAASVTTIELQPGSSRVLCDGVLEVSKLAFK